MTTHSTADTDPRAYLHTPLSAREDGLSASALPAALAASLGGVMAPAASPRVPTNPARTVERVSRAAGVGQEAGTGRPADAGRAADAGPAADAAGGERPAPTPSSWSERWAQIPTRSPGTGFDPRDPGAQVPSGSSAVPAGSVGWDAGGEDLPGATVDPYFGVVVPAISDSPLPFLPDEVEWLERMNGYDFTGDVAEMVDCILACPATFRDSPDFAFAAGVAFGRMVAMDGRGEDVFGPMTRLSGHVRHLTLLDPGTQALLVTILEPLQLLYCLIFWQSEQDAAIVARNAREAARTKGADAAGGAPQNTGDPAGSDPDPADDGDFARTRPDGTARTPGQAPTPPTGGEPGRDVGKTQPLALPVTPEEQAEINRRLFLGSCLLGMHRERFAGTEDFTDKQMVLLFQMLRSSRRDPDQTYGLF